MTLTAQYRPYRDEDCTDGIDGDNIGWPDHEPGIQIYEKTTEDLPFNGRRKSMIWFVLLSTLVGVLGFLLGYFSHSNHTECIHTASVSLASVRDEDATIRSKLLTNIDSNMIKDFARDFSIKSHIAGSDEDLSLALKIDNFFKAHNFNRSTMKNYTVLLSLPNKKKPNFVSIINQNQEIYSSLKSNSNGNAFSPYSPKGDVEGDVMFINYGRPVDYLKLQDMFHTTDNIFQGKILLAKQYHLSASEQYKYAMIMNASALLLYPDPQHYNPYNQRPFPESIWLPSDAVRSDSVFWNGAGDPATFGLPSNEYAFKDILEFSDQMSMPAQPISIETAYEIFKHLQGIKAPGEWEGGFNITYRIGPNLKNNLKVRVCVNNELVKKTVYNVIGTIRGRVEPDRYVIIGNQRDSASKGAIDSASGTAAFLELARVFGNLVRDGWKPRRSILFCSWGAEEYNLIGSTEWVEETLKILYMRAVAYVNINLVVSGNDTLSVAASPLLYHAIFNASREVNLPANEASEKPDEFNSAYDKWLVSTPIMRNSSTLILKSNIVERLSSLGISEKIDDKFAYNNRHHTHHEETSEPGTILQAYIESAIQEIRPHIRPLDMYGSYAPFFTMAGIPAIDISFIKLNADDRKTKIEDEDFEKFSFNHLPYPLLHTQYDDIAVIEKFVDPGYKYHTLVTQILSEVIRDLTDSLFLPFNLFDYAQLLKDFYIKTINLHTVIILNNKNLENFDQSATSLLYMEMKTLESAIHNFTDEAIRFHAKQDKIDLTDPMAIRRINDKLLLIERQFLDHRGIPSNNLKKHLILSPAETPGPISSLQIEGLFPALLDELDQMIGNVSKKDVQPSILRLQKHLPILINAIQSAADSLTEYF